MSSQNYERTAISIDANTLQSLQTLAALTGKNVSWASDAIISRYCSLMKITEAGVKEKFDSDEIWEIAKAIKNHVNSLRTANFRRMRSLLTDLKEEQQLDAEIADKAVALTPVELFCLIELSEIRIKTGKIEKEKTAIDVSQ